MIQNIQYFFIGTAFTLMVYHFFIWAGRRRDLSNLSFALFNLSYILFIAGTFLADYMKSEMFTILISHLMCCIMSMIIPFFAYTIKVVAEKLKKIVILCVAVIILVNISGILVFILTRRVVLFNIAGFIVTITIVVFLNGINIFYIIKDKLYKKEKTRLFVVGYCFLLVSLLLFLFFYTCFYSPLLYVYSSLLLHSSFTIVLFIFAYTLTRQFNAEHADLKELKETLEKKIDERTRQLKEANKQKTQFFINLAHETKTPLTLISNYFNEYSRRKGESYESEIIKNNLEKLKRDMINFLDYEKLQSGQIFYDHNQMIHSSHIINMQVFLFKELAVRKNITLTTDIQENVYIKMDPSAAERVINNLLDNAIKYSLPGGRINVIVYADNTHLNLSVADNGPGIPAERREQIFKPFLQLSSHKRNIQGIGMGLSIVKTIVEDAGGNIRCTSNYMKGTHFNVRLPRIFPGKNDVIKEKGPQMLSPVPLATGQKLREEVYRQGRATLFIVEDNLEMLYYLQTKFHHYYNVFYAQNGKDALQKMKTLPTPDIIISDIMMDTMNGFEFYDKLQTIKKMNTVPFIFLTALASTRDKIKSLYKGAIDYIYKPFDIDELSAKVHSILKIHAALKRENLLSLGERLFHYLQCHDKRRAFFAKDCLVKQESIMQSLYKKFNISCRQIQIIALLKIGLLRKEICDKLDISMNTLKTHITRLFEKCGVDNKTELLNIFY